jgi:hypothetical protein
VEDVVRCRHQHQGDEQESTLGEVQRGDVFTGDHPRAQPPQLEYVTEIAVQSIRLGEPRIGDDILHANSPPLPEEP